MSLNLSSLSSMLSPVHEAVLELFDPLIVWCGGIPALQPVAPYLGALPYLILGLGLILLLVLLRLASRRLGKRGHRSGSRAPRTAPKSTPVQGRALDDMSYFDHLPAEPTITSRSDTFYTPSSTSSAPAEAGPRHLPPSSEPVVPSAARTAHPPHEARTVGTSGEPVAVPPAAPMPDSPNPESGSVSSLESDFQIIYIKMYIDQQLTTNFSVLRANVNHRLSRSAPTEPLMLSGSGSTEDNIYAHLALASLDALHAPESHFESGGLTPHGQELCKIYDYAVNRLQGSGKVSEESARSLLQKTLAQTLKAPGASHARS